MSFLINLNFFFIGVKHHTFVKCVNKTVQIENLGSSWLLNIFTKGKKSTTFYRIFYVLLVYFNNLERKKDSSTNLPNDTTIVSIQNKNENNAVSKEELIKSLVTSKKSVRTLNSGRIVNIANTSRACQIQ